MNEFATAIREVAEPGFIAAALLSSMVIGLLGLAAAWLFRGAHPAMRSAVFGVLTLAAVLSPLAGFTASPSGEPAGAALTKMSPVENNAPGEATRFNVMDATPTPLPPRLTFGIRLPSALRTPVLWAGGIWLAGIAVAGML